MIASRAAVSRGPSAAAVRALRSWLWADGEGTAISFSGGLFNKTRRRDARFCLRGATNHHARTPLLAPAAHSVEESLRSQIFPGPEPAQCRRDSLNLPQALSQLMLGDGIFPTLSATMVVNCITHRFSSA
jgi:hypothetical protein